MPNPPATLYPTAATALPSRPYILSLTPHLTSTSSHLLLSHPSPEITIVDAQTFQLVDKLKGGHSRDISCVVTSTSASTDEIVQGGFANEGNIWSAGLDANVVRWDERSRRPGQTIKANIRGRGLPLLSLAVHEPSNLLVAGTELVSSESHLLFYDTRSPSEPLYTHSTTHSDDITSLTFLPPTSSYAAPLPKESSSELPTPPLLLLSGSTDGLLALTNPKESDEEEAFYGAEGLDGSVAKAGWYRAMVDEPDKKRRRGAGKRQGLKVWGRSDMDSVGTWEMGRGETGDIEASRHGPHDPSRLTKPCLDSNAEPICVPEIQLQQPNLHPTQTFKHLTLSQTAQSSNKSHIVSQDLETAEEEQDRKRSGKVRVDYLVDVMSTLGVNKRSGEAIAAVGSNEGDIVLMHHRPGKEGLGDYQPSLFLRTPREGEGEGHRDVVRCMWHDVRSQVLYTGSEDGVLVGWSLPSLSEIRTGDREHDEDPGDGREDAESDDEMDVDGEGDDDERDEEESDEEEVVFGRRRTGGKREASDVLGSSDGKRRRNAF